MSFEEFYQQRMAALGCEGDEVSQNPFKPLTIPLSVESPYYENRDIWRHYPNMYDFRRAAIFNVPPAVFYPYNSKLRQPWPIPEHMKQQDFRRRYLITKGAFK